jgi:hypothetical protein
MKTFGGVDVQFHFFVTSALEADRLSASRSGRFTPREAAPVTYWIDRMDPRASLANVEERKFLTLSELKFRPLSCPASSRSLYWLFYPDSLCLSGGQTFVF